MPRIEVTLPDRIYAQIETLVNQQDEFVSRDEATEELLEMGLRAYQPAAASGGDAGMDDQMHDPQEFGMGPDDDGGLGGPGEGGPGEGPGRR